MQQRSVNPVVAAIGWLVMAFLMAPIVIVIGAAVSDTTYLAFPPQGFSLRWFGNVLQQRSFMASFQTSMQVAISATSIALAIGLFAAYGLARFGKTIPAWFGSVFLLPLFVPEIVFGFSLLKTVIVSLELPVTTALIVGHTIICLPYMVRVISASLSSFDFSIEEAAVSLGMHPIKVFLTIVLPNIRSGVIAAVVLAFITSLNDVAVSLFLTGPGVSTLPIEVFTYVEQFFDPSVAAVSVLLMGVTIIVMALVERTLGLGRAVK